MIIEESPIVIFIPENNRQPGISAFMRIKNGEDYLKATILSIINQVDEIICVFNDCNDNTENILVELENEYSKIKVYKYIPQVYVMNSEKYLETEENSVHSFSYYSNFALSKTTKKYCIKIDDDELFFPNILTKLKNELYKTNNKYSIGIRGINLVDYKEELFVNNNDIYTNGGDTIFFKYNNDNKFLKTTDSERPLFYTEKSKGFSANTLTQWFFWLYRKAGVSGASSHSGRRTFITNLANKGIGVRVLAKLAGHRSIAVTQVYIDVNSDMMRKAVELV